METVKDLAEYCINYARNKGVTYVEARGISGINHTVMSRNGELLTAGTSSDSGLGVRIIVDGGMGFASFSELNKKTLKETGNLR